MFIQQYRSLLDGFHQGEYMRTAPFEAACLGGTQMLIQFVILEQVIINHRVFLQNSLLVITDNQQLFRPEHQRHGIINPALCRLIDDDQIKALFLARQ